MIGEEASGVLWAIAEWIRSYQTLIRQDLPDLMDFYFLSFQMKERNRIRFAERTISFSAAGDEYFVVSFKTTKKSC